MEKIGRNLKITLYDRKIRQCDLAKSVGVSEKTVSMLVNGLQCVSVETLANIAQSLDVTVDSLING